MEEKLEKIKNAITEPLKEQNIFVDSISYGEEDNVNTLFIVVDSDIVDLDMCVKATEIINPIVDKLNLIDEEYVLDVSGKVKGE